MRVALRHNTTYRFDRSVVLGPHDVRLRPGCHCRSPIFDYTLRVQPAHAQVQWYWDAAGNSVARCLFPQLTSELQFEVAFTTDLLPVNPFDFLLDPWAVHFPFRYPEELAAELAPALGAEPSSGRLSEWIERAKRELVGDGSTDTVTLLVGLNQRVHREIAYTVRDEPGVHSPEQTLVIGSGSCRDSSWLLVQVLRQLGFAARFVSGYLIQPRNKQTQEQNGQTQSSEHRLSASLHAWAEVYLPGAGWIGLDPTSGLLTAEGHIALAVARIPRNAAPVSGSASPSAVRLTHSLQVDPA